MSSLSERLLRLDGARYHIALLAVLLSLTFSLFVCPLVADPFHVPLDPDGYGSMGESLLKNHSLGYYPDTDLSVKKGPAYPALVALCLFVARGWWPYCVQAAQAVLLGVLCLVVFWTADSLYGRKAAMAAALVCALHPFLIWYTSRIWTETLITLLFTALVAATLRLFTAPSAGRAALVGLVVGLAALCKETFLPFAVLVPLLLVVFQRRAAVLNAAVVALVVVCIVAPWSWRNFSLTHTFVPVHTTGGYNMYRGDTFARNYLRAPLSYGRLWSLGQPEVNAIRARVPRPLPRWHREVAEDKLFLQASLASYRASPLLFLKKLFLNGLMFWTLGDTPAKSAAIVVIQIPLLALFALAVATMRACGARQTEWCHVCLVVSFFLLHLPIFSFARLSVVLVPTMVIYACGYLWGPSRLGAFQN